MKIITIANQKGGVGKTTTAVTLGHGLTLHGRRVLLVDCDPQGQVATFLGLEQDSGLFDLLIGETPLKEVIRTAGTPERTRSGLDLIPGDKRTATAQIVLSAEGFQLDRLTIALERATYDFIIFDTSPSVGLLQEAALFASDWLIVPTAVDYPSSEGLAGIISTLKAVNARGGNCKLFGVLPTMHDTITREGRATLDQLKDQLGTTILEPVHRATILRECAAEGVTIWEKAPRSRTAEEYRQVIREVLANEQQATA
jgi:chromosome partitioning protein